MDVGISMNVVQNNMIAVTMEYVLILKVVSHVLVGRKLLNAVIET